MRRDLAIAPILILGLPLLSFAYEGLAVQRVLAASGSALSAQVKAKSNAPQATTPSLNSEASRLCPVDLADAIAPIIEQPAFRRARWGIRVETLAEGDRSAQVLVDIAGDRLLIPASNVKLLTTAAALDRLGPAFQIHTSVYREEGEWQVGAQGVTQQTPATAPHETAHLRIVGRGDPTLTSSDLSELVQQIGDRGIRRIERLTLDDRYFHWDAVNPNWEWEDVQAGYGAPASSFILNRNELRLVAYPTRVGEPVRVEWLDAIAPRQWQIVNRAMTVPATETGYTWVGRDLSRPIVYLNGQRAVGAPPDESSISIVEPTRYFAEQLVSAFETAELLVETVAIASVHVDRHEQMAITRETLDPQWPVNAEAHLVEIARISSPSLARLLPPTNRDSENIYAETLLRHLGMNRLGYASDHWPTSLQHDQNRSPLETGIQAITEQLTLLGVDPTGYRLVDGSGLSRQNLISPAILVETLQAMVQHPEAQLFRESLAIAGISGTLRHRLKNTPIAGHLYAKTGGLTGVASLSGYLDPPTYEPLAVSIILNHSLQSGRENRAAIDEILLQLARLHNCHPR